MMSAHHPGAATSDESFYRNASETTFAIRQGFRAVHGSSITISQISYSLVSNLIIPAA